MTTTVILIAIIRVVIEMEMIAYQIVVKDAAINSFITRSVIHNVIQKVVFMIIISVIKTLKALNI
jgi:hypothetical protein